MRVFHGGLGCVVFIAVAALALPRTVSAQGESATANFYRESYALEAKREYGGALAKMR